MNQRKDKKTGPREAIRLRYVGTQYPEHTGTMMTLAEIAEIVGFGKTTLRDRWNRMGRPGTVDDALLKPLDFDRARRFSLPKKPKKAVTEGPGRGCTPATSNPQYLDPDDLPGIVCGDLAHLSDRRNTGAGRGECEHLHRSYNRDSMATASFGRMAR